MNPTRILWVVGHFNGAHYLLTGSITEIPYGFRADLYKVLCLETELPLDPDDPLWNDHLFNQWASSKLTMQKQAEDFDAAFMFFANDTGGLIN